MQSDSAHAYVLCSTQHLSIPVGMHRQEDGGFRVVVRATMAAWAVAEAGAPAEVWLSGS